MSKQTVRKQAIGEFSSVAPKETLQFVTIRVTNDGIRERIALDDSWLGKNAVS